MHPAASFGSIAHNGDADGGVVSSDREGVGELVDVQLVQGSQSAGALRAAVHHVALVALGMSQEGVQVSEHLSTLAHDALEHLLLLMELKVALELKVGLANKAAEWTAVTAVQEHWVSSPSLLCPRAVFLGVRVIH